MRVRVRSPEEQEPWEQYMPLYSLMGALNRVFQTNFPVAIQNSVHLSLEVRLAGEYENSIQNIFSAEPKLSRNLSICNEFPWCMHDGSYFWFRCMQI
jgi:hypothetical protein